MDATPPSGVFGLSPFFESSAKFRYSGQYSRPPPQRPTFNTMEGPFIMWQPPRVPFVLQPNIFVPPPGLPPGVVPMPNHHHSQPPLPTEPAAPRPPEPPSDAPSPMNGRVVPFQQRPNFPPRYHNNNQKRGTKRPHNAEKQVEIVGKKRARTKRALPSNKEDCDKALAAEMAANGERAENLILTFPDIVITQEMVLQLGFSRAHFQIPGDQRFVFVTPNEGDDVEEVIKKTNEIDFHGMGKLKLTRREAKKPKPNEVIDPFTLYIGNLPMDVQSGPLKEKFPKGRVDIGYATQMKQTRYAFVYYENVDDAIEGLQSASGLKFGHRSLNIRFRRLNGSPSSAPASALAIEFPSRSTSPSSDSIEPASSASMNSGRSDSGETWSSAPSPAVVIKKEAIDDDDWGPVAGDDTPDELPLDLEAEERPQPEEPPRPISPSDIEPYWDMLVDDRPSKSNDDDIWDDVPLPIKEEPDDWVIKQEPDDDDDDDFQLPIDT